MSKFDISDTWALAFMILAIAVITVIVVAFLIGFGFEAVKWLGHTQK